MKKSKFIISFFVFFVLAFTINTVNAESVFDTKETQEVYKASEDDSVFDIPFVRVFGERATIDKEISQLGMIISNSTLDITSTLKSSQVIMARDTIRINSDVEDVFVLGTNSVIINANVKNIIVFAGQSITIEENGNVEENIIYASPSIKIDGNVDGNVLGSSSSIILNGQIKGKFRVETNSIEFGEKAKLDQEAYINTTNAQLSVPEEIGNAKVEIVTTNSNQVSTTNKVKTYMFYLILALVRDLVAYVVIILFVKKENVQKMVSKVTPNSIIKKGVITYIVSIACILFGFTIGLFILPQLGWSAVIVGIALLTIGTLMKNIVVGTFISNLSSDRLNSMENKPNGILMTIMTFLMIELIETIPFIGQLIKFVIFIFAVGIMISIITNKEEKTEKIIAKDE